MNPELLLLTRLETILPRNLIKRVEASFATLRLALSKPIWVVAFSGGKDSSVLLDLVLRFIMLAGNKVERIIVIYSDTLMDPPPLREYAVQVIESIKRIRIDEVSIYGIVASPMVNNEDIVEMVVKKGYPAPSTRFRWCTDRWKIRPSKTLFRRIVGDIDRNSIAILTGVRAEEAAHRAGRALSTCPCSRRFNESFGGTPFMPLLDWRINDIWLYIKTLEPVWKNPSWKILISIYGSENKLRIGCWVCTLVSRDLGWKTLVDRGFIDASLYMLMESWRKLWIHFSRVRPDLWRYEKTSRKTREGRMWRYAYSKLREEARLALGLCLKNILMHPSHPSDVAKALLPKLLNAIQSYEGYSVSLCSKIRRDPIAAQLLEECKVAIQSICGLA